MDDLSNWYLRCSRSRFAGAGQERSGALDTLYTCLVTLSGLLAPFAPFLEVVLGDGVQGEALTVGRGRVRAQIALVSSLAGAGAAES